MNSSTIQRLSNKAKSVGLLASAVAVTTGALTVALVGGEPIASGEPGVISNTPTMSTSAPTLQVAFASPTDVAVPCGPRATLPCN
jgi:hypothetical protein